MINRGEHGDRFKNIQVHIGRYEGNHKRNPVCHDRISSAADGEAVRLQCNPPIPGRYVAVQMYGRGILTVCEVIVNSRIGKNSYIESNSIPRCVVEVVKIIIGI